MLATDDADGPAAYTALLNVALQISRFSYGLLYLIGSDPPHSIVLMSAHTRANATSTPNVRPPLPAPSPAYAASLWSVLAGQVAGIMTVRSLRETLPTAYALHSELGHRVVWYVPLLMRSRLVGFMVLARRARNLPSDQTRECVASLVDLSTKRKNPGLPPETPQLSDAAVSTAPVRRLHGLAEWARASQALHDSLAGLASVGDAQPLLSAMLADALRVAGTGNGAVALLEGEPDHEVAHHIVMLEQGEDVSGDVKRANHFERVPLEGALASFASRLRAAERGVTSSPGDRAVYPDRVSAYLQSLGVRSVHSVALRAGAKIIGWLGAGFPDVAPVSVERIDVLNLLAAQMSIAVDLARLATHAKADIDARERARISIGKLQNLSVANAVLRSAIDVIARDSSLAHILGHTLKSMCEHLFDVRCEGMLWSKAEATGSVHLEMVFEGGNVLLPGASVRFKALVS